MNIILTEKQIQLYKRFLMENLENEGRILPIKHVIKKKYNQ